MKYYIIMPKKKIYLILEYAEYGDIVDYNEQSGIFNINKHISDIYDKKDKEKNHSMEKSIMKKMIYKCFVNKFY